MLVPPALVLVVVVVDDDDDDDDDVSSQPQQSNPMQSCFTANSKRHTPHATRYTVYGT